MILDTLLLADAATATPDGKLFIHGGGITQLNPPALPWVQPLITVVVRLRMEEDDWDQPHQMQLEVSNPSGTPIMPPSPINVEATPQPEATEGEDQFLQMALAIANPIFTEEGLYRFDLTIDGELARSMPVAVKAPTGQSDE